MKIKGWPVIQRGGSWVTTPWTSCFPARRTGLGIRPAQRGERFELLEPKPCSRHVSRIRHLRELTLAKIALRLATDHSVGGKIPVMLPLPSAS